MAAGRLYVVATPIGNLEDISARALRILDEVSLIAAEDTRHTRRLLNHFEITTRQTSYHEHNEREKAQKLLERLQQGDDIALVTDAGTPGISDPGYRLVRAAKDAGIAVIPIPGPCAPIVALCASGLPTDTFTFHGFFPRKASAATALLEAIGEPGGTHLFLESPNRLVATLGQVEAALPNAEACVARELTKKFEDVHTASPRALLERLGETPPKGECVLIVHTPPRAESAPALSEEELCDRVRSMMSRENLSQRDAVKRVAQELGLPKNTVYAASVKK